MSSLVLGMREEAGWNAVWLRRQPARADGCNANDERSIGWSSSATRTHNGRRIPANRGEEERKEKKRERGKRKRKEGGFPKKL
jgi:hypothetical protein